MPLRETAWGGFKLTMITYFSFHTNLVKRGVLQQAVKHIGLLPFVTISFCYKDSQISKRFDET